MASIRLAVFEDNRAFRNSLEQLFRYTSGIDLVAMYPDAMEMKKDLPEARPDVILMDIDMPGMNGIDATAVAKSILPQVQVIMLTVSEEEDRIFSALRNGASGYILKKSDPAELIEGVMTVHRGGSPISPAIARKVLQYFHQNTPPSEKTASEQPDDNIMEMSASLTPREREILEGLVDGLSYKMIAAKHYISTDTVKNHIQGIYKKLHVHSKGEAISLALKKGIV